jgi:hypothetical protein
MFEKVLSKGSERINQKRTKQSSITSMGFPLLQKSTEMCVGRQIKILGCEMTWRKRWFTVQVLGLWKRFFLTVFKRHNFGGN